MEALMWLKSNKNEYAFASNHFNKTEVAIAFVEKSYKLGAAHVAVDHIYNEPWRIKAEKGPYADTLVVEMPASKSKRKKILAAIKEESPDEMDGDSYITLWWD